MSDRQVTSKPATPELAEQINAAQPSLLAELVAFLLANKKWWLTPIIAVFLLIGVLVLLSGTAAAPFIYTLF